jgi:uncharacterized protein YqjF (DUF2071 family)
MAQRWCDLAYFHWQYEPREVQRLLPAGIHVDTFDGMAWVGLVPFVMRDVHFGPTPPIPYLGTFVEINVRTYVFDSVGRRAVWFFSLDVPRMAIVAVARSAFALPYCWARTRYVEDGHRRSYSTRRRWPSSPQASADLAFTIGRPMAQVTELDHFLTARWALLTTRRGRPLHGRISHPRWPLHEVDDFEVRGGLVEAAGLTAPVGEPRTACSPGVEVEVGWLERVAGVGPPPRST